MKRYAFSLAGVLRLRVQQAEAAEAKLAFLYAELQTIQTRQQEFDDQLQKDQDELLTPNRVLAAESLLQMDAYRRWAAIERRRQTQVAAQCIARIQEQNARVIAAKRNQQLLEKLRDRTRQRWELDNAREEQALAEEAFMSQWGKHQGDQ
jgi:flagellar export protein FliJ